jgi:hypothetical protein
MLSRSNYSNCNSTTAVWTYFCYSSDNANNRVVARLFELYPSPDPRLYYIIILRIIISTGGLRRTWVALLLLACFYCSRASTARVLLLLACFYCSRASTARVLLLLACFYYIIILEIIIVTDGVEWVVLLLLELQLDYCLRCTSTTCVALLLELHFHYLSCTSTTWVALLLESHFYLSRTSTCVALLLASHFYLRCTCYSSRVSTILLFSK